MGWVSVSVGCFRRLEPPPATQQPQNTTAQGSFFSLAIISMQCRARESMRSAACAFIERTHRPVNRSVGEESTKVPDPEEAKFSSKQHTESKRPNHHSHRQRQLHQRTSGLGPVQPNTPAPSDPP